MPISTKIRDFVVPFIAFNEAYYGAAPASCILRSFFLPKLGKRISALGRVDFA